jgi:hypothetical protein
MLFDMIKEVEQKASVASPVPEPRRLDAADREVVQHFVDEIRQQILAEMAAESIEAAGAERPIDNEPETNPLKPLSALEEVLRGEREGSRRHSVYRPET